MPTPIRSTTTLKKHFKIKAEAFACHRHFSKGSSWPSKMQSGLYMLLTLADNLSSWKVLPFLKAPCRVEQGCSSGLRKKGASIVEPSEFHQKRVKKAAYIHTTFRVSTGIEKYTNILAILRSIQWSDWILSWSLITSCNEEIFLN